MILIISADVRVYSFTFILSVDYLLKIADFFNMPQEESQVKKAVSTKSTTNVSMKSSAMKGLKSKTSLPAPEPEKSEQSTQMTVNLKLEKPDIILVEHMDNIDTNAIIVNVRIFYIGCITFEKTYIFIIMYIFVHLSFAKVLLYR